MAEHEGRSMSLTALLADDDDHGTAEHEDTAGRHREDYEYDEGHAERSLAGNQRRQEVVTEWLDRLRDGEVTFGDFIAFSKEGVRTDGDGKYLSRLRLVLVLQHCRNWRGASAELKVSEAGFGDGDSRVSSLHKSAEKAARFAELISSTPDRRWPPREPFPDKWPVLSKLEALGETDIEKLRLEPSAVEELASLIRGWRL